MLRGAELLGDVPAAAALLGAIALATGELSRPGGPRYRLVAAAPACAAAFYLRYGNVLDDRGDRRVLDRRVVARHPRPPRPGRRDDSRFVGSALPFVAMSRAATGSPIAILTLGNTVANRAASYPGAGIVEYVSRDPFELYGAVTFVVVAVALVQLARGPRSRARSYAAAIAGLQIVAVGAVTLRLLEGRYVLVATALLVAIGIDAIVPRLAPDGRDGPARRRRRRARRGRVRRRDRDLAGPRATRRAGPRRGDPRRRRRPAVRGLRARGAAGRVVLGL